MIDLLLVLLAVGAFVLAAAYVAGCERLQGRPS